MAKFGPSESLRSYCSVIVKPFVSFETSKTFSDVTKSSSRKPSRLVLIVRIFSGVYIINKNNYDQLMHLYTTQYAMQRLRRNETDKNVTYSFGLLVITVTQTFRVILFRLS